MKTRIDITDKVMDLSKGPDIWDFDGYGVNFYCWNVEAAHHSTVLRQPYVTKVVDNNTSFLMIRGDIHDIINHYDPDYELEIDFKANGINYNSWNIVVDSSVAGAVKLAI